MFCCLLTELAGIKFLGSKAPPALPDKLLELRARWHHSWLLFSFGGESRVLRCRLTTNCKARNGVSWSMLTQQSEALSSSPNAPLIWQLAPLIWQLVSRQVEGKKNQEFKVTLGHSIVKASQRHLRPCLKKNKKQENTTAACTPQKSYSPSRDILKAKQRKQKMTGFGA